MITRANLETAYSFFHQKWRVYKFSTMEWQKEDIEYAISSYVDNMNKELLEKIAGGSKSYLRNHSTFSADIESAVEKLEAML